jgi:hypothetical protein
VRVHWISSRFKKNMNPTSRNPRPCRIHRKPVRVAMSLAEVMVVTAVTTILCGVAISLLISLRDWDQRMRRESRQNDQSMRLSQTLRSDIRRATAVATSSPELIDVRLLDDTNVRYELTQGGCRRTESKAGETISRLDWFDVGEATAWTVTPAGSGRRPAFTITLQRSETPTATHPPELLVRATQGADTAPSLQ